MGGGRDSLYKRKSSKKERDITSSRKKSRRKELKKHGSSSDSEHTSVSPSKSNHKRRIRKDKKLRHVYSTSSSSHDQSASSYSDSSSYDYKRKSRRSRLGLKTIKKRGQQRSARAKGDGDASEGWRKNKRLGRDAVAKPKKKPSKKKLKKYSSSYSSSDSESCSTCRSDSTADDSKRKRSKIIIDSEKERPRGRESHTPCKKPRLRSPSSSSCDRGSKHIDGALPPLTNDNNNNSYNGRLRSVIAVVDQRHDEGEENRWEMNSHKEEIVYDRKDYPSLKGPESNEEGNKMEIVNQSHSVGNISGEEITECGKSGINEGRRQLEEVDMTTFEKGKEIGNSVPVADSGGDVLELILRQKALENLKRFKGRLQTGPMSTNNLKSNNVNRSSNVMVENIQNKSTEQEGNAREINQNSGLSRKSDISKLTEIKILACRENVDKMDRNIGLSRKSDISKLTGVKILSDSENVEKMDRNNGLSRKSDISKLTEVRILSDSENVEKMDCNVDVSQKKDPSKLTEVGKSLNSENIEKMDRKSGLSRKRDLSQFRKLSDSKNVEKEPGMGTQTLERPTDRDALVGCSKEAKSVIPHAVLAETLSRIEAHPGAETMNVSSSSKTEPSLCIESMSREHGLERGNEARDGSQYEQKTMSVMRGGEMVEVSYKVYIPKKAAALARRPLRR
ncbi:hypothetical protein OROGR_015330 [Orobanche gracilis]